MDSGKEIADSWKPANGVGRNERPLGDGAVPHMIWDADKGKLKFLALFSGYFFAA